MKKGRTFWFKKIKRFAVIFGKMMCDIHSVNILLFIPNETDSNVFQSAVLFLLNVSLKKVATFGANETKKASKKSIVCSPHKSTS